MLAAKLEIAVLLSAALTVALTTQFAELAKTSGGRVGICIEAIEGSPARQELNGAERFPMQSVYKLPIAMAVLDAVDRKTLSLEHTVTLGAADMAGVRFHSPLRDRYPNGGVAISVRDLIRAAIVDSDGVASDALYRLAGGGPRITAYVRALGITGMAVVATEREMSADALVQYRNSATPRAAVALLRALQTGRGLSPAAREMLLQDLTDSGPGAKRIKGLLPTATPVAHKTGTDGTTNGLTRATNDIGLVTLPDGRHLAIAVFVKDSTADEGTRERTIAAAAKLAFDAWMVK
jgi:beta-lactamase class A